MPAIGSYVHRVRLEAPGQPVPDGEGGYTEGWITVSAGWDCSMTQASQRDLERIGAGTVLSQATHLVHGHYLAGVTTKARLVFKDRILNVIKVVNPWEKSTDLVLVCAEVVE